MAPRRGESRPQRPPATTPRGREQQLIAAAVDLAEQRILNGTASSQIVAHYLKLASTREQLEQEKLANENELLKARVKTMESSAKIDEMYANAIAAMRAYSGITEADDIVDEILRRAPED